MKAPRHFCSGDTGFGRICVIFPFDGAKLRIISESYKFCFNYFRN